MRVFNLHINMPAACSESLARELEQENNYFSPEKGGRTSQADMLSRTRSSCRGHAISKPARAQSRIRESAVLRGRGQMWKVNVVSRKPAAYRHPKDNFQKLPQTIGSHVKTLRLQKHRNINPRFA